VTPIKTRESPKNPSFDWNRRTPVTLCHTMLMLALSHARINIDCDCVTGPFDSSQRVREVKKERIRGGYSAISIRKT
jgi:hypothetical protein